MKVLVCGGRYFDDRTKLIRVLDDLLKELGEFTLIEGDASGVDRLAGYWARKRRLTDMKFPADWQSHGRAAGPIRNEQMLREGNPDLVVAFPGGRGTAHMVGLAERAGVPVRRIA